MEQRSRAQKYQQLREKIVAEPEKVVKSNDLSRYAKQMESYQTPASNQFQFEKQEPTFGSRSRISNDYLNEIKKESDTIDQILQQNDELMKETVVKPSTTTSRASKYASMFVVDDDVEVVNKKKEELTEDDWFVVKPVEKVPVVEEKQPEVEEVKIEKISSVFASEEVETPMVEVETENNTKKEEPVIEETSVMPNFDSMPVVEEEVEEPDFDIDAYEEEPIIKDHYMDDILLEAKKYSVDKGQRAAIDTTATILSELTQTAQEPASYEGDDIVESEFPFDSAFASEVEELLGNVGTEEEEPKVETDVESVEPELEVEEEMQSQIEAIVDDNITADFFMNEENEEVEEYIEEEPEKEVEEPVAEVLEDTQNASITSHEIERDDYMELTMKLDQERIFREEMMQKTKQMKLQLDEYETELNTVTNKVSHTSMVLNFVLILLILALFCLLAFIGYWALVDRGLLAMLSSEEWQAFMSVCGGNWL